MQKYFKQLLAKLIVYSLLLSTAGTITAGPDKDLKNDTRSSRESSGRMREIKNKRISTDKLRVKDNAIIRGDLCVAGETKLKGHVTAQNGLSVCGQFDRKNISRPLTKRDVARRKKNGQPDERFDIIIVGAGTAGSLLTARLAARYPDAKILVLETGKDDVQDDNPVRAPDGSNGPNPNDPDDDWGQLIREAFLAAGGEGCFIWQQPAQSLAGDQFISEQGIVGALRGATLGGNSAIAGQVWNSGTKQGTYDKWAEALGEDPNDPTADFGWDNMIESIKAIENHSQETGFFGVYQDYWLPNPNGDGNPPPLLNQGDYFDSRFMGKNGELFLTQALKQGYSTRGIEEIALSGIQPGRQMPLNLEDRNPNNPPEYHSATTTVTYDQSDRNFPSINPYRLPGLKDPMNPTPGSTYVPPLNPSNEKGPEFAALPLKVTGGIPRPKALMSRSFPAPAFLYPIIYDLNPNNVTIKTEAYVTKLLFDNPNNPLECTGVEYVVDGWHVANIARAIERDVKPWKGTASDVDRSTCTLEQAVKNQENTLANNGIQRAYASADIWLCAGAIDNPALLQRSGIGPREFLENIFPPVACKNDLKGVGRNLQDTAAQYVAYVKEIDLNTYLPASLGLPSSVDGFLYPALFGFADTPSQFTASIFGASLRVNFVDVKLRVRSEPSLPFFDFDLLCSDRATFAPVGNSLWQDIIDQIASQNSTTFPDMGPSITFDRSLVGGYDGNGNTAPLISSGVLMEYWNVQSKGEVRITSGNVFDRPVLALNYFANENDLVAFENNWLNNIIPLLTKLNKKRFGPRGPFMYVGALGPVPPTINSMQLLPFPLPFAKPFAPSELIDQATYDTLGSLIGAAITLFDGPAAGQTAVVTAWSGNTGNPATSYVANVVNLLLAPTSGNQYGMLLAGQAPYDSVEFTGNNNRNFVRFLSPSSNDLFSDLFVQALPSDPLTTEVGSTRITINAPNHNLEECEYILISGVDGAVNGIPEFDFDGEPNFNNYHVVDKVIDPDTFQIVIFWNNTARPGTPGAPPVPSPAVNAVAGVGGGDAVQLHTLKFDRIKFRNIKQRNRLITTGHFSNSCRMGLPDDVEAVVDTRARVYNTLGLRASDASILPVKPNGNTMVPLLGITQRLFELISVEEYDKLLKC